MTPSPINLADPDFEPTDEQLIELSKQAFAGVGAAHDEALRKLRAPIAEMREVALREFEARRAAKDPP